MPDSPSPSPNALARFAAQRLAFAPLMFQACRALRDLGLLKLVALRRDVGLSAAEGVAATGLDRYAAELLLEAGLASGLLSLDDAAEEPRFFITPMGHYWLRDPLTRVNAEFNHHVCYKPAFSLRESLLEGRAAGLPSIDATGARTVYEALHALPDEVRTAWLDFDHYYSDGVFEDCARRVLSKADVTVVDIGGNTGRFARICVEGGARHVTLVDHRGTLALAKENLSDLEGRLSFAACDVLDESVSLPEGADVYWLSQFLDCFSEAQVRSILSRVRGAMRPDSRVFILETFWDQQRHEAARFCVIGTSLYFACVANGCSRMYHSKVMKRLVAEAGLRVVSEDARVGLAHTLLECGMAEPDGAPA